WAGRWGGGALAGGRAFACGRVCCSSCSAGDSLRSGSPLSTVVPETSARGVEEEERAVTFPPPICPPPGALRAPPSALCGEGEPPGITTSLSVRERVKPRETYCEPEGLPSTTPLPSASKPDSVGSTWA